MIGIQGVGAKKDAVQRISAVPQVALIMPVIQTSHTGTSHNEAAQVAVAKEILLHY